MSRKIEFLVVLGDGGHSAETIRLVELMGPADYNYTYAITTADRVSENNLTIPGPVYHITRPRAKDDKVWPAALKLIHSLWQAIWLLHQTRPDAVLGSGPAVMVPIALLGRLTGARIIYVETGCRVTDLSLTGKIMLKIAHLFFVQWEQLQKRYPHTVFAGRLL
jgi:UDP-N-acetylglucosamine:LPS N-acetylglucosamine transferase